MSQAEFERWFDFYQESPFDDTHRYHRPAALIAKYQSTAEFDDLVKFLKDAPVTDEVNGFSAADMNTFKAFGIKPPKKG